MQLLYIVYIYSIKCLVSLAKNGQTTDETYLIETPKKLDKKVRQAFCLTLEKACYN